MRSGNPLLPATPHAEAESLLVSPMPGQGIKLADGSVTWRDLEGPITVPSTGANRPTLATYIGDIEDYAFAVNDHYGPLKFHIPHDWVVGTDFYIHAHWSHNGTNISGGIQLNYNYTYAKGHNQANFHAMKTLSHAVAGLSIANTPSLRHRIDEMQLSQAGGSATLLDTALLEPDGLILVHFDVPVIPTITGGALKPFIHYIDIHYQSTNVGTKNKAPSFYHG